MEQYVHNPEQIFDPGPPLVLRAATPEPRCGKRAGLFMEKKGA